MLVLCCVCRLSSAEDGAAGVDVGEKYVGIERAGRTRDKSYASWQADGFGCNWGKLGRPPTGLSDSLGSTRGSETHEGLLEIGAQCREQSKCGKKKSDDEPERTLSLGVAGAIMCCPSLNARGATRARRGAKLGRASRAPLLTSGVVALRVCCCGLRPSAAAKVTSWMC